MKKYNCFSLTQLKYIKSKGIEPIHKMIHTGTKKTFWIFKLDDELSGVLKEWSEKRKIKETITN